jgi:hypothetical protein
LYEKIGRSFKVRDRPARGAAARATRAAGGEVLFQLGAGMAKNDGGEVRGKLLDHSAGGFRAQHGCTQLTCGQIVEFRLMAISGVARVVWTRILGDRVESGFLILR